MVGFALALPTLQKNLNLMALLYKYVPCQESAFEVKVFAEQKLLPRNHSQALPNMSYKPKAFALK
ncbi:hypothetical protein PN36_17780 [Candidatus Thiomargarita nelsonii]|uniref:Uncharacterized protein n=1 Tax=Candidatus Thiomargarita nelsonii TaxID=1003181 RepID=A0A4E0RRW5_9GAMM|nr:hypothetical protein PN36_17780 [Candidatus Thiomargarita nelsonii]